MAMPMEMLPEELALTSSVRVWASLRAWSGLVCGKGRRIVAPDAGEDIREPQPSADYSGHALDVVITCRVAAPVVDPFESVEVNHEHRRLVLVVVATGQRLIAASSSSNRLRLNTPVRASRVARRLSSSSSRLRAEMSSMWLMKCSGSPTASRTRGGETNPHDVPVFGVVALVHLIAADLAVQQPARLVDVGVEIVGMGDVLERQRDQLMLWVSDDRAQCLVDSLKLPSKTDQGNPNGRVGERRSNVLSLPRLASRMNVWKVTFGPEPTALTTTSTGNSGYRSCGASGGRRPGRLLAIGRSPHSGVCPALPIHADRVDNQLRQWAPMASSRVQPNIRTAARFHSST